MATSPDHPRLLQTVLDTPDPRRLAFQLAPDMPAPRWPEGSPPQMLHLDLTVGSVADLERQRSRAVALGAEVLLDRTADEDEPLYVLRDPAGHRFCVFVAPEPSDAEPA
ncbi:VOC family protein [Clavibacter nebraskensis]|uniref:VOC family protein n=1 Tax=Clavibacter nebraskensis TaxID=31963 RepID=UPI001F4603EE|nr:VOC family protein [Clavibacter nebraskensis]UKF28301.1 VOC family protein [Clavibacter nebraskensis]UQB13677.1 VOC family protein [Clavibacter nebraskensis]UQB16512.1 VOC family protein [Clavibacter nebraskensis]